MQITTDIVLGDEYRDAQTGITGIADSLHFYQHGCERVTLQFVRDGEIKQEAFDSPRLVHTGTGVQATTTRPGGPGRTPPRRP